MGTPDEDPDYGDVLLINSVGSDPAIRDGFSSQGGTISINDNNTPADPSDDFVDYIPPTDFVGSDTFQYVITDQNGSFKSATVIVNVTNALPVSLVEFSGKEKNCQIHLNWTTASELNNEYLLLKKVRMVLFLKTSAR